MKKVLITGANSYIGDSVREYLLKNPDQYSVDIKDTMDWIPLTTDFEGYDVVFHVAGIAHRKETKKNARVYYKINRDLAISVAEKSKGAGVRQFIIMSTMSVYGKVTGFIEKKTKPNPKNCYGKSKLEADRHLWKMRDEKFRVVVLRPPMIYGKDCKGNYQRLRLLALISPVFPDYQNQRSMLYIGNLCNFVKECIDKEKKGLFFPQNDEYTSTSQMIKAISECHGKQIELTKIFNWAIKLVPIRIFKKAFGDLTYEAVDLVGEYGFMESIRMSER